jgi:PAS domain S-box-containing protein
MTQEMGSHIRKTLREGNVWSGELEIQKRDQTLLPILGTIAPILDEQGKLDGWIGIATDMTTRKESEQAAKRRAEEMSFLYQFGISVASGRDLYTTLLTLRTEISKLITADAFYVAIYNIETDIVSYPIFFEEVQPIQEADRILSENPGFTGAVIFNKKTIYIPDMMTQEVEDMYHPYNSNGSTLRTFLGIPLVAGGRVIGMISVQCRDVDAYKEDQVQLMETLAVQAAIAIDKARLLDQIQQELAERKRTEAALTFSEGKFYKAFHTTPVLMSIEDEENRFIDVNRAFMDTIGYERENVIGRRASDLQMWGAAEDIQVVREKLKEGNNLKDLEIRYRRNTGEVGYVLMSSEKFEVNGTSYSLTSALDITERKRAEADLQRELEERKRITADLLQRESILDAVAFAAELLLNSPNWRDEINTILERLGKCITASHAYLFQNHELDNGLLATSIIFEWTSPGYSNDLTNPKYINSILTEDDLASWYTNMKEGLIYVGDNKHLSPEDKQYLLNRGIFALLDLPIIINGQWWGTIGFDDMANEREWTSAEMDVLRAAANVLGAAIQRQITDVVIKDELIQRRKLVNELEQKNAESETLRETTVIVASTLNSSESVQRILEQLKHVISYDSASVWLYKKNMAVMVGWNGLSAEALSPGNYALSESEPDYPLRADNVRYILLEDIQETYPQFRTHGLEYIHGWLAVPLRARGQLTGFISLDGRNPGQFTRHDAELALTYGNQVAIALENAHLFTELQEELKVSASLIEELESKNAELERFTYTVSHDLKSPLITIRGFLGFIEQDTASGNMERLKVDIKRISDATEKMQRLLQELLQLSRIGRMKNEPTRIPFEEIAREAVEITQGQILKRNVTVNIQKNLPSVLGDRPRIVEVLQNLVDNAAKFMGNQPNPVIEIGLHGKEDGKAVFFVRDNGIGIAPNFHESVFGLFDKLDVNSEGTGVGLAIVKRIIEVHGGKIWVESEIGKGSTFFFSLARGD